MYALIAAALGLVVAIASVVETHIAGETSEKALALAKAADDRSKNTDEALFHATVLLIKERLNEIVDSTKDADWQLENIGLRSPDALMIQPNKRDLAFIQHLGGHVASADLSNDQIAYLAKGPADIAATVAQCIQTRNELVADLNGYKDVTPEHMTAEQQVTFPILPNRIRRVSDACMSATGKLSTLVPIQFKEHVIRGTVGELDDAQAEAIEKRRKAIAPKATKP
ncbi:hypothetical protein [Dyella sp. EPa41]|uniref:hypothetical protein n=1 Tax=Dyella sp. EPa41 TaxID=1561194 RepID=UPI0019156C7F|nr:hypothetical protein [Dyella sp. EPa41]